MDMHQIFEILSSFLLHYCRISTYSMGLHPCISRRPMSATTALRAALDRFCSGALSATPHACSTVASRWSCHCTCLYRVLNHGRAVDCVAMPVVSKRCREPWSAFRRIKMQRRYQRDLKPLRPSSRPSRAACTNISHLKTHRRDCATGRIGNRC